MKKHEFTRGVRRAIKKSGRRQAAIAEDAGVLQQHIAKWQAGTIPSVVNADALLRALGVRLVIGDSEGQDLEL